MKFPLIAVSTSHLDMDEVNYHEDLDLTYSTLGLENTDILYSVGKLQNNV